MTGTVAPTAPADRYPGTTVLETGEDLYRLR
jgi:hypothetical protein